MHVAQLIDANTRMELWWRESPRDGYCTYEGWIIGLSHWVMEQQGREGVILYTL